MKQRFRLLEVRALRFLAVIFYLLPFCACCRPCLSQAGTIGIAQTPFEAQFSPAEFPLNGIWLIHAGDDLSFADPKLDDSDWMAFDIYKSMHLVFLQNPNVVWYRLHVKTSPGAVGLAVDETNISKAFNVYSDGVEILRAGRVAPYAPARTSEHLIARIPEPQRRAGSFVLTVRTHIDETEWADPFPGLYPGNLTLGKEDAFLDQRWFAVMNSSGIVCLEQLITLVISAAAFVLYSADKKRKEYLWLTLYGTSSVLLQAFFVFEDFHAIHSYWQWMNVFLLFGFNWFYHFTYFGFVHQRMSAPFKFTVAVFYFAQAFAESFQTSRGKEVWFELPTLLMFIFVIPSVLIVH